MPQKVHHIWKPKRLGHMMKSLSVFLLLALSAGCADFPELEGREAPSVKTARYPKLIPLTETSLPQIDPVSEAAEVEEDLTQRSKALSQKAKALQNASTE